jgi:hypothetical protein
MADDFSQYLLSPEERAQLISAIYKIERVNVPGVGYRFDLNRQVLQPAFESYQKAQASLPEEPDQQSYYRDIAPAYSYWKSVYETNPVLTNANGEPELPVGATFETYVIHAIEQGATPTQLNQYVLGAVNDEGLAAALNLDPSKPYTYTGIAENLYNQKINADINWEKKSKEYKDKYTSWYSAYGDIPDPSARYKVTDFAKYNDYETGIKTKLKERAGAAWTPDLETGVVNRLRANSQQSLDKSGITPFTDWAIRAKAYK